jgi:hypothetical protein
MTVMLGKQKQAVVSNSVHDAHDDRVLCCLLSDALASTTMCSTCCNVGIGTERRMQASEADKQPPNLLWTIL